MIINIKSTFQIHSKQFNSIHIWDLSTGSTDNNRQIRTSEKMTLSSICYQAICRKPGKEFFSSIILLKSTDRYVYSVVFMQFVPPFVKVNLWRIVSRSVWMISVCKRSVTFVLITASFKKTWYIFVIPSKFV